MVVRLVRLVHHRQPHVPEVGGVRTILQLIHITTNIIIHT